MIAPRWQNIDFEHCIAIITKSIYRNVVGNPKTRASRKPIAVHPVVIAELQLWRAESDYKDDSEYIFASTQKNGTQPLQPDMVLKRHIRPALKQLSVVKTIGWHSFRHGLGTMFRLMKMDVRIAQEMLRHADSRHDWIRTNDLFRVK